MYWQHGVLDIANVDFFFIITVHNIDRLENYLDYSIMCLTRFSYQRMFVSVNSNKTVPLVEQKRPVLPEPPSSPPVFSWVRVWSLYCQSFFDLRLLITYPFGIFKLVLQIAIYICLIIEFYSSQIMYLLFKLRCSSLIHSWP